MIFANLALVAILLTLAGYSALRQRRIFRLLATAVDLTPEDRAHYRTQARRRLLTAAMMVIFAGFLVGWIFLDRGDDTPQTEAQARFLAVYWGAALLVLLVIMVLAVMDLVATARYGVRKIRQLEDDRKAMLHDHAMNYRREKREGNGTSS